MYGYPGAVVYLFYERLCSIGVYLDCSTSCILPMKFATSASLRAYVAAIGTYDLLRDETRDDCADDARRLILADLLTGIDPFLACCSIDHHSHWTPMVHTCNRHVRTTGED